jgi:hypothetical protein
MRATTDRAGTAQRDRATQSPSDVSSSGKESGSPPPEPLVVVGPAIQAVAALSGGVPSIVQVAGTLVVARLVGVLPSEVLDPILQGYRESVDAVIVAQATAHTGRVP